MIQSAQLFVLVLLMTVSAFAKSAKPNILVIFTDDQTYRAIGYSNPEVKTPTLDALAANGMIFDHAYVASPICGASRAAMMSGTFPQQNGVVGLGTRAFAAYKKDGQRASQTLAHQLSKGGYETVLYGKSHLGKPSEYGFSIGVESRRPDDRDAFAKVAAYLDARATDDKPFFIWLAPRQPHVPLYPEKQWLDKYPEGTLTLPHNFLLKPKSSSINNQGVPKQHFYRDSNYLKNHNKLPAGPPREKEVMREFIRAYYAVISRLDHQVGKLVVQLKASRQFDNTVIIFLSDNGYHLGSHGLGNKITMHEESVRVPMFMTGPGVPKGAQTQALVSSLDVYPTVLELAGIKPPIHVMGQSLVPLINDPSANVRDAVFSECVGVGGKAGDGHRMVRSGRWKLVLSGVNEEFLFDLKADPFELNNQISNPEYKSVVTTLRSKLHQWMARIGDRKPQAVASPQE